MKTVPKKFQKEYSLTWEEVHGYASSGFLVEILKVYSPSFKPFHPLRMFCKSPDDEGNWYGKMV